MPEQSQKNSDRTHQSFLSRLCRRDSQVFSLGVVGVDLDAIVGLRLTQPSLQQRLDVNALPGASAGVGVDFQRTDSDSGVVSLLPEFEAGDLQEDGGDHVGRPQVNPQLGAQDVFGLDLRTEAEQTTGGQFVLGDRISWKKSFKH